MKLRITRYELLKSEVELQCDCSVMYWEWLGINKNHVANMKEVRLMMKCYQLFIPANTPYVNYEFVDEETGELLELNCRTDIDSFLVAHKRYPPIIQRAINLF